LIRNLLLLDCCVHFWWFLISRRRQGVSWRETLLMRTWLLRSSGCERRMPGWRRTTDVVEKIARSQDYRLRFTCRSLHSKIRFQCSVSDALGLTGASIPLKAMHIPPISKKFINLPLLHENFYISALFLFNLRFVFCLIYVFCIPLFCFTRTGRPCLHSSCSEALKYCLSLSMHHSACYGCWPLAVKSAST